jgi:oligopeptidase B
MMKLLIYGGLLFMMTASCHTAPRTSRPELPSPPRAAQHPVELTTHGDTRVDEYYWLRERENSEVMAYLEAENAYATTAMEHTQALQETLFAEIKGRIKQTDSTAPVRQGDYLYYTRFEDGKEYPVHCRRRDSMEAPEEVLLDVNKLAQGHDFCQVGSHEVGPGQQVLAYTLDTQGRRLYTLRFRDLTTGQDLPESIGPTTANIAWAEDDTTLFYTLQDEQTLRWDRIKRHVLGTGADEDVLVFEEQDDTYNCYVWKTRSRRYIMIGSEQTVATEYHFIPADAATTPPAMVLERRRDHEYYVDHAGDYFYIRTNDGARNFRLMRAPVATPDRAHWEEVIAHRDDVLLDNFELFQHHLVTEERHGGLLQIHVRRFGTGNEHAIDFGEPTYAARVGANEVFETSTLRYEYSSLATPESDFDYDMDSRASSLVKRQEVLGGFDAADYRTERLWAVARDGTRVPISIVYRDGFPRDGSGQVLLYGYGSYGHSLGASFSAPQISLLDRGVAYAIAHVRGGSEMGRSWYDDGKLLQKMNTFTDFIDCAEHLVQQGYSTPDGLYAMGGSAGGLLMGVVANMRPDLFGAILASVPFVDVVTTMLDETIPLTTGEYDEWGNPNEREYYDYMLSYSPYENVGAMAYPPMLVLTGLNDSQVQYWEPAKWVARLRTRRTDDSLLIFKTEMEAGHGGPSGRYRRYREMALQYAFILNCGTRAGDR